MLTREVEGAQVKCGRYWDEGRHGPLDVRLRETEGTPAEDDRRRPASAFDFGAFGESKKQKEAEEEGRHSTMTKTKTVRRVFELRHAGRPQDGARVVTQLQYLDWPDFNVPDDPGGLLALIRQVDEEVERARARSDGRGQEAEGPVLTHCSAGVGRTGGFIMVDAVLDAVRREMREQAKGGGGGGGRAATVPVVNGNGSGSLLLPQRTGPSRPRMERTLSSAPTGPPPARDRGQGRWDTHIGTEVGTEAPGHVFSPSSSGSAGRTTHDGKSQAPAEPEPELEPGREPMSASSADADWPRRGDAALVPLSAYDEPVRRVLEDMRRQRMSLCQSLRQYVFVHRAIVEGALQIVDEERAGR
jgi:protein tyrosine phosphatase